MSHIYSRFASIKNITAAWKYKRKQNIFENGSGVCRMEFAGHRGIASARPYQSSFPVTVRHLSVSLAQLAGPVSCGTKQHRWNLWMCFHRSGTHSGHWQSRRLSPSNRDAKGEVSLRRCHVNMIFEGVAHS